MSRGLRYTNHKPGSRWAARTVHAVLLVFSLCCSTPAMSQDAPEYRMEIGGGVGMASYQGDFGGALFKQMQPIGGAVAKYKPNPRMAWSAELEFGKLKGASANVKTWYPEWRDNPMDFATSLTQFDVRYEYNFWAYGTGREYRGARPLVPFIAAGLGLSFASTSINRADGQHTDDSVVGLQLPIGFGVKYKLANRLNLTAEWTMHFTGTDRLDGTRDPYGIESSGLFKNTDCYSVLQLTLTYDMWAKCKTCHNDRD